MKNIIILDKQNAPALCSAIVLGAIKDWKSLCKKEAKEIANNFRNISDKIYYHKESFDSIKNFLISDYGESVCLACNVHPDVVCKFLDEYRAETIKKAREAVKRRESKRTY